MVKTDNPKDEQPEEQKGTEGAGEKRGRGRPRKPKSDEPSEPKPKRPRGRPLGSKKKPDEEPKPKGPRGRPRKAAIPAGQSTTPPLWAQGLVRDVQTIMERVEALEDMEETVNTINVRLVELETKIDTILENVQG